MELHGARDAARQHHAPERLKEHLRASTTEQGEQVAVLRKQLRERQAAGEEQINGKEERWNYTTHTMPLANTMRPKG